MKGLKRGEGITVSVRTRVGVMVAKREADIKKKVQNSLGKKEKSVKEIAKRAGTSTPTASKYLMILEAEGRAFRNEERPPYVLWSLKR